MKWKKRIDHKPGLLAVFRPSLFIFQFFILILCLIYSYECAK